MKKLFTALSMVSALCIGSTASAREDAPEQMRAGFSVDLGTPSGAAVGLETELPYLHWMKLDLAASYLLSPGVKGDLLLDPIQFPVAPVVDADIGWVSSFTVPGVKNSPSASFTYEDVRAGLAFGRRDFVRFYLLGGMTHLDGNASNLSGSFTLPGGVQVSDAHFSGWLPSCQLKLSVLF